MAAEVKEKTPQGSAKKICFVVGPIGDAGSKIRGHADWLLDEIISPVFTEHFKDFNVVRSDKITQPGMIDSQVINHLLDDDLVIADMTLLNPNAFYEMGIRHMERKPIIHMYLEGGPIPFDVKPYRAIGFSFEHPRQRFDAQIQLKQAVEAVLAPGFNVENPVTRARGVAQISQHAMPGTEVLMTELGALQTRLRNMEARADYERRQMLQMIEAARYGNAGLYSTGLGALVSTGFPGIGVSGPIGIGVTSDSPPMSLRDLGTIPVTSAPPTKKKP